MCLKSINQRSYSVFIIYGFGIYIPLMGGGHKEEHHVGVIDHNIQVRSQSWSDDLSVPFSYDIIFNTTDEGEGQ